MVDSPLINRVSVRAEGMINRLHAALIRSEGLRGYGLISPTLIVMILTMCLPLGLCIAYSVWSQDYLTIVRTFTLSNYHEALSRDLYWILLLRSLAVSGIVTVLSVLLAYPAAYYVAFHVRRNKTTWIILLVLPFLISYLLRVFSWKIILGYEGIINTSLMTMGFIDKPLGFLLYNPTSVVITLTCAWAPFAILPIFVSLEKIDRSLLEAANDLGDGSIAQFLRVTLPLSRPGLIVASLMIFIPTAGDFITPDLVGGTDGKMIANIIQAQFGRANDWPLGSSLSLITMIVLISVSLIYIWITRWATTRIA